jgi:hypothetical protein
MSFASPTAATCLRPIGLGRSDGDTRGSADFVTVMPSGMMVEILIQFTDSTGDHVGLRSILEREKHGVMRTSNIFPWSFDPPRNPVSLVRSGGRARPRNPKVDSSKTERTCVPFPSPWASSPASSR